jgi:hypothetical protein
MRAGSSLPRLFAAGFADETLRGACVKRASSAGKQLGHGRSD